MSVTKVTDENIVDVDASKLVGSFGTLDGSNLTNVTVGKTVTKATSDPTQETNPADGVGTLYLNTSSGELFCCVDATTDFNVWKNTGLGTTGKIEFSSGPQYFGNRGLFFGGNWTQMTTDAIQYLSIPSLSNTTTFGDLNRYHQSRPGCLSNGTRAVCVAGNMDGPNTGMDYVTVATPATSQEFGTFAYANTYLDAVSNGTRGLITPGAYGSASMPMEYITVQTNGNSTTFGSVVFSNGSYDQHCGWMPVVGNGTRAIMLGGYPHTPNGPLIGGIISYVVIATQSNASQFGTLNQYRYGAAGLNDRTYGVCWGGQYYDNGYIPAGNEWITMATNGNALVFGGVTVSHQNDTGACSNSERGVIQMYTNNEIEYMTMANPNANAVVFGQNSISSNQAGCGATSGNA